MEDSKNTQKDVQEMIFEDLKELHDYWGENNRRDMLDFCARNQLRDYQKTLTILMRPDWMKT